MDPITSQIIIGLGTSYFSNFTTPVIQKFFQKAVQLQPSIEEDLKNARSTQDFEKVFRDAVGVIDAQAGTGTVEIDFSFLEALKGIRFDHQNGLVTIAGSRLHAPILQAGGTGTGSGQTEITDSILKSGGAEARIGKGASMKISRNAQIRLS
ncbi:MAG: hypothetical protein AAB588_04410 [Patescibacteria group bacterium]